MKGCDNDNSFIYEVPHCNKYGHACDSTKKQVIFPKTKVKKRQKYKFYTYARYQNHRKYYFKSNHKSKNQELIRFISTPEIRKYKKICTIRTKSSDRVSKDTSCKQFNPKLVVNFISEYLTPKYITAFNNTPIQRRWKVYRCQLSSKEESCCCSCNSDAMFEVMKSLYDCYKKKNCDHCNCILCGHLAREEREQAMIRKSMADMGIGGHVSEENIRKAKAAGLLVPLEGKSPEEKEKILKGRAMHGLPLHEGKTPSEKKLIDKIRAELGLPPEPISSSLRQKYNKAASDGILQPLEGKTPEHKENILRGLAERGIPLPEGRTPSEKALIAKFRAMPSRKSIPSEKIRKSKTVEPTTPVEGKAPEFKEKELVIPETKLLADKAKAGLLTPLTGKTPAEKEKILKGLAMAGLPLPEGKTPSEHKLINKTHAELGLPPPPGTPSLKEKHHKAAKDGLLQPLEGKSPAEKEKILRGLAAAGLPLPEGRIPSEKALIAKIKEESKAQPEKPRKSKVSGLITPLTGKTPAEKEKVLRDRAMAGLPLPEGKTPSEQKLIDKTHAELGLPPPPGTPSLKEKHHKAAKDGLLQPLEGKSPAEKEKILRGLAAAGLPLPEGRIPSEKALIAKIKEESKAQPEKPRKSKVSGLITPLTGKTPAEKEKVLRDRAMAGLPLPEGKTPSEQKLIDKTHAELGLPPPPGTPSLKEKHHKAAKDGLLQPLEGKTPAEKEKILRGLAAAGLPLPEGRTPSEKTLIPKIKAESKAQPEKPRKSKVSGLMSPVKGKTPAEKEKILKGLAMAGLPLPEGKTPSEQNLIDKTHADLGLPPAPRTPSLKQKYHKAAKEGLLQPLEGKTPAEKEKILRGLAAAGLPLPEGRTPSEKASIAKVKTEPLEKLRKSKAAGLVPTLSGKPPADGRIPSEKALISKDKAKAPSVGIASEKSRRPKPVESGLKSKTPSQKEKILKDLVAPSLLLLEGKTPSQKHKILQNIADRGIPLPEGKTPSDRALIAQVKAGVRPPSEGPKSEVKIRKRTISKALGPPALPPEERKKLDEKTAKVIKEGKGPADECICDLLTPISERERVSKAKGYRLASTIEGKTPEQKERILRGLVRRGIPLPEGKTPSEKKIIDKIKIELGLPPEPRTPSIKQKYDKAYAAGLITPLEGKSATQKERILKGLFELGIPLPEGRTPSEKALIISIKGVPPLKSKLPSISSEKQKIEKPVGLLTPLEGKTPEQKEKMLRGLVKGGFPLPEGKTPSEKTLIRKIKSELKTPETPSEKMRKVKAASLVTAAKTPPAKEKSIKTEIKTLDQKEEKLRGLVKAGLPLPEPKSPSEIALINKIRNELGLPPEPDTPSLKEKYKRAHSAGMIVPLEGKTPAQKENILRKLQEAGIPLPEGRTPSEKSAIRKLKVIKGKPEAAKAATPLSTLEGKTPSQKEKHIRDLAKTGFSLPEGKTASEKSVISKIRKERPEPKSLPMKEPPLVQGFPTGEPLKKAKAAGLLTPLKGKTPEQKENLMKTLAMLGHPLPENTESEKKLADKIRLELGLPPSPINPSEKNRYDNAQAAGFMVPLEGRSPAEKEKILRALVNMGVPLPQGRTPSERSLILKIKAENRTPIPSEKLGKAKAAGLLTPLSGKTPAEKEKILRGLAEAGLPLPEGTTSSQKSMIRKIRAELALVPSAKKPERKVSKAQKIKTEGLLTPLAGKTAAEKEKTVRGLAEAGLPLPEGKTVSEKDLIKKIKGEFEVPLSPTPSKKKGKIKGTSKKVSAEIIRKERSKAVGIGEEFEDIIKTTTCDRGCGCDKKKIRFKHSYVKIRVTSPDISSLCPCPDECIPGVKSGIITDNEGIKVTIGSAVGVPSYSYEYINVIHEGSNTKAILTHDKTIHDVCLDTPISSPEHNETENALEITKNSDKRYDYKIYDKNDLEQIFQSDLRQRPLYEDINTDDRVYPDIFMKTHTSPESNKAYTDSTWYLKPQINKYDSNSGFLTDYSSSDTFRLSSCTSIFVSKTESSLSLTSSSNVYDNYSGDDEIDKKSSTYLFQRDDFLDSIHYKYYPLTDSAYSYSNTTVEKFDCQIKENYSSVDTKPRDSFSEYAGKSVVRTNTTLMNNKNRTEFLILRMCQAEQPNIGIVKDINKKSSPIMVINHLSRSDHDIMDVIDEILTKGELFSEASLIMIVPSSEENDTDYDSLNSTLCIQMSVNSCDLVDKTQIDPETSRNRFLNKEETHRSDHLAETAQTPFSHDNLDQLETLTCRPTQISYFKPEECKMHCHKRCQVHVIKKPVVGKHQKAISTDTTEDRPCNCPLPESKVNDQCVANVVSEFLTPVMTQGVCEDLMYIDETLPVKPSMNHYSSDTFIYQMPPCSTYKGSQQPQITSPNCRKPPMQRAPPKFNQIPKAPNNSGCEKPECFPHPCFCGPSNINSSNKRGNRVTYKAPDGCRHTDPNRFRGSNVAAPTRTQPINTSELCDNYNSCNHHIQLRQMKSKLTETDPLGIKLCMSKNTSTTGCLSQPLPQDQCRKSPVATACKPATACPPRNDTCGQPPPPSLLAACGPFASAAPSLPTDTNKGFKLQICAKGPSGLSSKECT